MNATFWLVRPFSVPWWGRLTGCVVLTFIAATLTSYAYWGFFIKPVTVSKWLEGASPAAYSEFYFHNEKGLVYGDNKRIAETFDQRKSNEILQKINNLHLDMSTLPSEPPGLISELVNKYYGSTSESRTPYSGRLVKLTKGGLEYHLLWMRRTANWWCGLLDVCTKSDIFVLSGYGASWNLEDRESYVREEGLQFPEFTHLLIAYALVFLAFGMTKLSSALRRSR